MDDGARVGGDAADERAATVRWVRTWQRAGAELEERRRARLAAMTVDDMRREVRIIFCAPVTVEPRRGSGLVEMQRLFARLR